MFSPQPWTESLTLKGWVYKTDVAKETSPAETASKMLELSVGLAKCAVRPHADDVDGVQRGRGN